MNTLYRIGRRYAEKTEAGKQSGTRRAMLLFLPFLIDMRFFRSTWKALQCKSFVPVILKGCALCPLLLLYHLHANAQLVDKVIDMEIYKSYYSYKIKNPLYVTYTLYKGGGPCNRETEGFNFSKCGERTAGNSDYTNSGYERGHLVNAEDFAGSCTLEKKTFCYFNCVAQTNVLNHGKWLDWEFKIREMSRQKRLFIIAGSIFGKKKLKPQSDVLIPDYCYKIVMDQQSRKILYCLLFKNDDSDAMEYLSLQKLKSKLRYPLVPEQDL